MNNMSGKADFNSYHQGKPDERKRSTEGNKDKDLGPTLGKSQPAMSVLSYV